MKKVYFSKYIDVDRIEMVPESIAEKDGEEIAHRFSLTIPFAGKKEGGTAFVIMKNPSNAGKRDEKGRKRSDATLYNVLDYLHKQEDWKIRKVTIVNLFTMVSGTAANLKEYIGTKEELHYRRRNDDYIRSLLSTFDKDKDVLIAGWGNYRPLLESAYNRRIKEILALLGDHPLHRVGPMVEKNKYPGHGKLWYDYEEILPYPGR